MSVVPDISDYLRVEDLADHLTKQLSDRFALSFSYDVNPITLPTGHEFDSTGTYMPTFSSPHVIGYAVRLYAAPHKHIRKNARSMPIGSVRFGATGSESPTVSIDQKQFRNETRKFLTGR